MTTGVYRAVKRALREVYREETINVNLTEMESMKIADSTGTIINPATKENQNTIITNLTSLDNKITKCDTDKVKIVDSTETYTLVIDEYGRVTNVDKCKDTHTGSFVVAANSLGSVSLSIGAYQKVAIYITVRDSLAGRAAHIGRLIIRTLTYINDYGCYKIFANNFYAVFDGGVTNIKIVGDNTIGDRDLSVEYRLYVW